MESPGIDLLEVFFGMKFSGFIPFKIAELLV